MANRPHPDASRRKRNALHSLPNGLRHTSMRLHSCIFHANLRGGATGHQLIFRPVAFFPETAQPLPILPPAARTVRNPFLSDRGQARSRQPPSKHSTYAGFAPDKGRKRIPPKKKIPPPPSPTLPGDCPRTSTLRVRKRKNKNPTQDLFHPKLVFLKQVACFQGKVYICNRPVWCAPPLFYHLTDPKP